MKDSLKTLFMFSFGAAVGSVVTFFGVKKYYEVKADLEVESVRDAYNNRISEIEPIKTSIDGDIKGPKTIDSDEKHYSKKNVSDIVKSLNNKPPLTDYTKYFKETKEKESDDILAESETPPDDEPYTDEEDKMQTLEYIDHELNGASREAIRDDKPPYVIDRESYELTCDHYDKLDLLYYIHDDILCDDDNTEVGRMVLLGTCIEESGFADNDDESLFVRNDKTMTDFEITKIYTPYEGK